MTLTRYNRNLLPSLSNWFDDFLGNDLFEGNFSHYAPKVNIRETNDEFHVEVAAPGMKKDDFNISLDDNVLTIASERKEEHEDKNQNYTRQEFDYHAFRRSFTLPQSVKAENIKARYDNGILNIIMPKKEEAKQKPAKTIKIN